MRRTVRFAIAMFPRYILRISLCCSVLFLVQTAWSQATTSLSGVVADPSGAVVPGAAVKLTSTLTGLIRSTATDKAGEYSFPQLTPGRYELTVSSNGFATAKKPAFDLLVSEPATINIALQVATSVSAVTVVAGGQPILNTTDATLGNTFEGQQIRDLPIEGRNVPDLLSLQPGVTYMGRTDNYSGSTSTGNNSGDSRSGATNGGRSDQSNITLDGVDVNDVNNGYAFTSVLRVTQDSIGEFRVTTSNPTADEGHSAGAQVALVTKSGTNALHGTVYEYNRNDLFHANDFFNKQTEIAANAPNTPLKLIRNVFGAAVGGPIKRDKAFYFLNYEGRRDTEGAVSNGSTVPTQNFRNGYIEYQCDNAADCPANGSTVAGDYMLSPAQLTFMDPLGIGADPAALSLLNKYPMPNNFNSGNGLTTAGYNFAYDLNRRFNTYIARLDWNIDRAGKHTAFFRGNLQNDYQPGGPNFPGQPPSSATHTNNKGFASGYTYVINPYMVNSLLFGLTRQGQSASGLLNAPYVTLQGVSSLYSYGSTYSTVVPVYDLADNFTLTKGNHNLAFGTDIRFITDRSSDNSSSFSNATGQYQYIYDGSTFGSIAGSNAYFDPPHYDLPKVYSKYKGNYNDAIMGLIGIINEGTVNYNYTKSGSPLTQGAPLVRDYRWNEYDFYGQDTWKATKNLTLTYGLHYTYLAVPAETSGNQVGVCLLSGTSCAQGKFSLTDWVNHRGQLAASGQAVSGAGELGFPLSGRYNGKPDYWTPDKLDLGPRLAVAYSPDATSGFWGKIFGDNRTSIRAGYSMVYDHFGAAIAQEFDSTGAYGLATSLSTSAGALTIANAPRFTSVTDVPQSLLPPAPVVGFPGIPTDTGLNSGAISWSEDSAVKTPYVHEVDFSVTRQLGRDSSLQVSYVGNFAHRLLEQEDVAMPTNLVAAGTNLFAAAAQMSEMSRANGGNGVPVSSVAPIPYWETLFGALDNQDIGYGPGWSATQNIYQLYQANLYNETNALYALDMPAAALPPGNSPNPNGIYPSNRFFNPQYSALYAWRSIGNSNFNGLEAVYRQKAGYGLQFDLNYTYAKSLDITSQAERLGSSGGINNAQIINTWEPNQLYGPSDYDVRHQLNANYIWNLPFGRGQQFASGVGRLADLVIGGWQNTGIVRWTSGFPYFVNNSSNYPTNYDIDGFATQIAPIPKGRGKLQQRYADPEAVRAAFDFTLPGSSGTRNPLRGDGYFELDSGLGKTFNLTERFKFKAGMEVFNVTNSVRFDAHSISNRIDAGSFGNASTLLNNPRLAQFYGRVEF